MKKISLVILGVFLLSGCNLWTKTPSEETATGTVEQTSTGAQEVSDEVSKTSSTSTPTQKPDSASASSPTTPATATEVSSTETDLNAAEVENFDTVVEDFLKLLEDEANIAAGSTK